MTNIVETALVRAPDKLLERNFATILLWVIVGLTVSLLLWAALAHVDEVVHANGRIIPSSRLSCCRFRGHRDKVFYGTGGYECNDASSAASSSSRR
jgi:hypothetical protein